MIKKFYKRYQGELNFEKVHSTNNLFLRFIGNRCSSTYGFAILQLVRLEDRSKVDTFLHKYWAKIAKLTWMPTHKWGTFYRLVRDEDPQP